MKVSEVRSRWALAAGIATVATWGVNFSFVKHVLDHVGPWAFLFVRFTVLPALGLVLLLIAFRGNLSRSVPRREDWPRFIVCGLVGHTVHIALINYGMKLSTAFSSSLVIASGPLLTLLLLALLGAERLRAHQVAGTAVACAGILVFLGEKFTRGAAAAGLGDLLLLGSALCWSLYTILSQPLAERYGPLVVLAYTLFIGSPPVWLISYADFAALPAGALKPSVLVGMAWSVVLSSFIGWLIWTWVNSVRGLARSAPIQYLSPPVAGVVAWLTLGEQFTALKLGGAAVAMAGIAWAQFGGPPRRESAQPESP